MSKILAVVVGAGSGSRFGGALPKQYQRLAGTIVFRRALERFIDHPLIAGVQPVISGRDAPHFEAACGDLATLPAVHGGDTRSASVSRALTAIAALAPTHVLVHDAARPLVSASVIDRVVAALADHDAVIPGVLVRDTLKRVVDEQIEATVDRTALAAVQTPQGFAFDLLRRAHAAADAAATDDAALVERLGTRVRLVAGDAANIKLTESGDLALAERLLAPVPKVGTGFDVHRLTDGDGLVLGGLHIPCDLRLIGHSDADVALHSLTDALLGTLGIGDIGTLFPPTEERWKGADSALFLAEACRRVRAGGGEIGHLDLTLLCERPRIGPYREPMRARIAAICDVGVERVSVKATTTERLGFTGRGEGIAAQAAATVLYAT